MESLFWGGLLRLAQVLIFSAPWIAIGFMIAGVFRVMVGPERTRRLFGGNGVRGLLLGWLWGMLLPVCSFGVIPIVRELHRSGVKGGTLIAFALTAPLFNPLSILYGLTLSDPLAILTFAFCSLIVVGSVGFVWDKMFPAKADTPQPSDPVIEVGIKRVVAMIKASCQMIWGPPTVYIIIGIFGSVAMSLLLPHGAMSTTLERENVFAPVVVAGLGVPIYSTPLLAMSQIGSMFQHGNSIGAAFSLLVFGAGVNVGLFFCFWRLFGLKQVIVFFSMLLLVSVGLAYLVGEPLYPKGVEVAGHTHAFDVYTNPFTSASSGLSGTALREIEKSWGNHEFGGSPVLLGMLILGVIFFAMERLTGINRWIESVSQRNKKLDIVLPNYVITTVTLVGLIAVSIIGCYVYYPSKRVALKEMTVFNVEAVVAARSGNYEGAAKWISYQEDLVRRLEVGAFIRSGQLSEYHRIKARLYRDKLELLKHEVEAEDPEQTDKIALESDLCFRRLKRAFLSDGE